MPKFPIPDDLIEIIKKIVVIEEEEKRKKIKENNEDFGERLYDYEHLPSKKEYKQTKIEISLE